MSAQQICSIFNTITNNINSVIDKDHISNEEEILIFCFVCVDLAGC